LIRSFSLEGYFELHNISSAGKSSGNFFHHHAAQSLLI
jgi:hypothetical protein